MVLPPALEEAHLASASFFTVGREETVFCVLLLMAVLEPLTPKNGVAVGGPESW